MHFQHACDICDLVLCIKRHMLRHRRVWHVNVNIVYTLPAATLHRFAFTNFLLVCVDSKSHLMSIYSWLLFPFLNVQSNETLKIISLGTQWWNIKADVSVNILIFLHCFLSLISLDLPWDSAPRHQLIVQIFYNKRMLMCICAFMQYKNNPSVIIKRFSAVFPVKTSLAVSWTGSFKQLHKHIEPPSYYLFKKQWGCPSSENNWYLSKNMTMQILRGKNKSP